MNGLNTLDLLADVSFTFGTWRLEGEACIHGVFMTVLLVAGSYSDLEPCLGDCRIPDEC